MKKKPTKQLNALKKKSFRRLFFFAVAGSSPLFLISSFTIGLVDVSRNNSANELESFAITETCRRSIPFLYSGLFAATGQNVVKPVIAEWTFCFVNLSQSSL